MDSENQQIHVLTRFVSKNSIFANFLACLKNLK